MKKKVLAGIIALLLTLTGASFITARYFADKFFYEAPQSKPSDKVGKRQDKPYFTKPVNILVIGIDQRGSEKSRSDTIMVYHLDPASNKIGLLTVPRDTYVDIPSRGMDKVNHAYAFGGMDLSKKTLEKFLGIKIDYYIETNFTGFQGIIDQIGGINLDVEKNIRGGYLKPGLQKLNGEKALAYVRDRKDRMGDIARVKRQQKFAKALVKEIKNYTPKWKLLFQVPNIYSSINTDLSLDGCRQLLGMVQKTDFEKAQMEVVPGWFYNYKGISYWKPDALKNSRLVDEIFGSKG